MASPVYNFIESLAKQGCQCRVVSIERLPEMQSTLGELQSTGGISPDIYPEIVKYFNFDSKQALPEARSIIIAASPQLPSNVLFDGQMVTIPPTYIYRGIWDLRMRVIKEYLTGHGYQVTRARLPFKTLAVRSGLGRYGRNNVCYIPGMGSYLRLAAFYSDMPCDSDSWGEPQTLNLCETCRLCAEACPTGAISPDRFLIHAEKCLTHYNESENPLPGWIKPDWHNALLGCMRCQQVCPLNKAFLGKQHEITEKFDAIETVEILAGTPLENLKHETRSKLESLCLADNDIYPVLKRNLALLIRR